MSTKAKESVFMCNLKACVNKRGNQDEEASVKTSKRIEKALPQNRRSVRNRDFSPMSVTSETDRRS